MNKTLSFENTYKQGKGARQSLLSPRMRKKARIALIAANVQYVLLKNRLVDAYYARVLEKLGCGFHHVTLVGTEYMLTERQREETRKYANSCGSKTLTNGGLSRHSRKTASITALPSNSIRSWVFRVAQIVRHYPIAVMRMISQPLGFK